MKRLNYILFIYFLAIAFSCSDYLDVVPDNVPTVEHAFLDRTSAERYLATCYSYFPSLGSPTTDPAMLGSDEWWGIEDPYYTSKSGNYLGLKLKKGEQNSNDPMWNYWDGMNWSGQALFRALKDCNIFLENVHNVGGDLSEEEATQWAAEVKILKAYYHYYLMKMYGPIPLQKESLPVSAGIDEVKVYRDPFDECVDYLADLIDEAVPDLPLQVQNQSLELGRVTQPMALSLKAEMLVMAASPLFNGNPDYSGLIDNRGVQLISPDYDQTKWQRAATACKNAIDTCLLAGNELYEFTKYTNISDSTKRLLSLRQVVTDKWNKEIIFTNAKLSMNQIQEATFPIFSIEQRQWLVNAFMCPTLRMAELFYSKNGVPIDEDTEFDYENRYDVSAVSEEHKFYIQPDYETLNLNMNREPRFYANLAFDGAVWFGNGRYKDVGQGNTSEQPWVFKTKKAQAQGKTSNLNFSLSGYWVRKTVHFESVSPSSSSKVFVRATFPVIRLADLYLLCAEALNESMDTPTPEVYHYIDMVRARAGLNGVVESWAAASKYPSKPLTKEGLREIIRQERMIELAFEGKRFWDIRRWKTAYKWLNEPIRGLNSEGASIEDFNTIRTLYVPQFSAKDYLFPIRQYNLQVNPNLVQNPYWQ